MRHIKVISAWNSECQPQTYPSPKRNNDFVIRADLSYGYAVRHKFVPKRHQCHLRSRLRGNESHRERETYAVLGAGGENRAVNYRGREKSAGRKMEGEV